LCIHDQTARRVTEKLGSSKNDDKTELLAEKLDRRGTQNRNRKSLLDSGKAGVHSAGGKTFYSPFCDKSEEIEHQSGLAFEATAHAIYADCFASEVLDGFELGQGDDSGSRAWRETGYDLDWNSPNRCGHGRSQD